jgi:hypothetical protein
VIAAYFRPQGTGVTWKLPGTAWVLVTLGAGIAVGIVTYVILLRRAATSAESVVLILGSIAFASGIAVTLRLSAVVVCFVAGLFLANFPGAFKERLSETLSLLERPIYLLFLLTVGAMWRVSDWRGWVLMAVFLVARAVGKYFGTWIGASATEVELARDARMALRIAPMGALSIAIVVNAELLYAGGSISWLVTAILGGAIVTEVLVQLVLRGTQRPDAGGSARAPSPLETADEPGDTSR